MVSWIISFSLIIWLILCYDWLPKQARWNYLAHLGLLIVF